MNTIQITSPEQFKEVIQKDEYAISALLALYAYQTTDEQISRSVKHQNGMGFNGTDGGFCSSLAQQFQRKGRLTEKQIASLKRLLPKYHGQISELSAIPNGVAPEKKPVDMTMRAILKGNDLYLSFPYSAETVAAVKEFPNRKWSKDQRRWETPLTIDTVEALLKMKFEVDPKAVVWFKEQIAEVKKEDFSIPGLRANLYEYQKEGIAFIDKKNGRALVGDEMGLGKTLQALGWLQLRKDITLPAIVVCPASLKLNWAREALKFTELEPVLISGRKKTFTTFPGGNRQDLYIINYDILHEKRECPDCKGAKKIHGLKCKKCNGKGNVPGLDSVIKSLNIKTAIFDEVHYCKSNSTGRSIAGIELSTHAKYVITLSGTPIVNRPIEFYNAIQMTNNKILPTWWQYTKRYCDRKHTGFGWDVSGASNTEELHQKLTRSIMIRRLKKDVLPQLPTKIRTVVPMEVNLKKYDEIITAAKKELKDAEKKAEHLVIIEKAKQAVVELKMGMALEWIQDFLDNGQKLVVFAEHQTVINQIYTHFGSRAVRVYGGTSQKERQAAVDAFQNNPSIDLFIGSKSAKEGLTLTAASSTCFLELWWVSGDHDQAEDRVHRIGQEADSVTAYYLLAAGTIEEDIAEMLDRKRKVVTAVLDGKDVEEESMLVGLMNKIMGEEE
jgi:SWI/SNF-related matrix-associated actin-dependent regulator 1 of chromatin subfamily A